MCVCVFVHSMHHHGASLLLCCHLRGPRKDVSIFLSCFASLSLVTCTLEAESNHQTSKKQHDRITVFAPDLSRCRNTSLFYWIFIPFDLLSLILQGAGGALSALSSGLSHRGVNIALAGLSLQVVTLLVFCALYIDFLWRYYHRRSSTVTVPPKDARSMKLFYGFEMLAVVAILARCAFRVHELSDGYSGPLVGREDLFIGLEGV